MVLVLLKSAWFFLSFHYYIHMTSVKYTRVELLFIYMKNKWGKKSNNKHQLTQTWMKREREKTRYRMKREDKRETS